MPVKSVLASSRADPNEPSQAYGTEKDRAGQIRAVQVRCLTSLIRPPALLISVETN